MTSPLPELFNTYACTKLGDSFAQIERCLNLLTVEKIWHRPNEVSNAIGNLVIHLNGNLRQWILASLGDAPDDRQRQAEFDRRDPSPTEEILAQLRATLVQTQAVIAGLSEAELAREVTVQGYRVSGLAAVFHVVEHFSLHTGQIVYATKLLINQDLSLYDQAGQRRDGRDSGTP